MKMKQLDKFPTWPWSWSWWLASLMMFMIMCEPVTSQTTSDRNSTLVAFYCSQYKGVNENYFLSNLNTTLSSLRKQFAVNLVRYAIARTLPNGESVWGLAACREYVSNADCVACFDYAVVQLKACGVANGAYVFYDDCNVRYENFNFYAEVNDRAGLVKCNNKTSPHPIEFKKTAQGLLSDLRTAVPRTSNFYAASTRGVAGDNGTVYAIALCNLNISQSGCLECLSNRYTSIDGCLPSTSGVSIDRGCFMRYSRTPFFGQNQTTNITHLLWVDDSWKKSYIIWAVGGVSFILLLLFLWQLHRSKNTNRGQQDKSTGATQLLQGPAEYSYNDLKVATNNFSDEFKLGGGVFGEVYKGTLKNGDMIAIKKTIMGSGRGKKRFHDELKIISNIHHRHLIRLLGYCSKGSFLFLVHEYMENGSLDQVLFGDYIRNLNWKQRFEIIFGTARGLAYLHEQYHVTIIHGDIKNSNILLDNEFQPKIADFGLIRLLPEDKTHLSTKLAGSLNSGYVAPEYTIHGHLSEKVDTYSFGVVVLEIISGKRYKDVIDDKSDTQNLLDHAWKLYTTGTHLNLMDNKLDPSEYAAEEAMKIIEIGLMCTQSSVSERPAMSEVVMRLSDKSPARSTILNDVINVPVGTSESLASNATTSTVQFSGR